MLRSRRIDLASHEDEFEALFRRGWTDGLPVVPPTEARVMRMLDGTARAPDDIVATVPPDLVPLTVEKVAIAAVMAGCLPEYMPWVLTAIEAVCNDEFNMHGVLATTMPVGPVLVCSGPGTVAIGMNSEGNALGQGNRANLTIGRALQLVIRNVGGGKPGGVDRATHGNPGKLSFCFAERADTPFSTLAEQRGLPAGVDAVTVFAGEGPRGVVDQLSREPESLASTLASCLRTVQHPKLLIAFDAVLVLSPEHGRVFVDAGWDTTRVIDELRARLQIPGAEFIRGAGGIAEGMPEGLVEHTLNKFRPGGLMLAYAGSRRRPVLLDHRRLGGGCDGQRAGHPRGRTMTRDDRRRGQMPLTILDPTSERVAAERARLARPASLEGLTVGLLDISKARGDVFLDRVEVRLQDIGANVKRYRKPTFTKPAPVDLRHEIATQCNVVIEALAD